MLIIIKPKMWCIKRYLKTNTLFYIISTFVLTIFLVIIGILFMLLKTTMTKESQIINIYREKQVYTIIDNFYDTDGFYEFRQHSNKVNLLSEFYNALVQAPNLEFVSMFNQPIYIEQFRGNEQFFYNSQEFRDQSSKEEIVNVNVKAVQMNSATYNLYQLNVLNGSSFDWSEVDYKKNTLPILLGSDYRGVYDIGDNLVCNYYGRNMTFEVIGILEANTFVYFKGDPEFYIDKYLVIPYPEYCVPVDEMDFHFEGILYFAMINGDVITNLNEKKFLNEIKSIANTTGFIDFSVVGIPDFNMKYDTLISVIKENQNLLLVTMVLSYILVVFIQYGIGRLILSRRLEVYKTYFLMGVDNILFIYIKDISIPYIISLVGSIIITGLCLNYFTFMLMLFMLLITVCILGIVCFFCKFSLTKQVLGKM